MRILWVTSASAKTLSNTRLFGVPPLFNRWGDESLVLIRGRRDSQCPDYFITLPIPVEQFGIFRILARLMLPIICIRHRIDVLLSDWSSAHLASVMACLRKFGLMKCRLVHDVRTVPVKDAKTVRVYRRALKYARRHFDGITTITEPLREEICREFGLSPDVIAVWTSGVDVEHFRPRDGSELRRDLGLEEKFVLFYHGAVNENRGVLELARAFEFLRDRPDLRLLIVGGGNQWDRLRAVVHQENLDQVMLRPAVPYARIPDWIVLADLCVVPLPDHPWWQVSSPLKLMEYLAMGKPVLLTEMSAHRAIIPDDGDAFYVPEATPKAFAEGIRRAMTERHRFAEMGQKGRRKAEAELTWEKQADALRDYLKLVFDGKIKLRDAV